MSDPPRRTSQRRPAREEIRLRLLDAATRVFAERGIDGASLDDVAMAADLTKGAIYSNFSSKADLVYALMDEHIAGRERQAVEALEAEGDIDDASRRVGAVLTEALHAEGDWQRLFIEFWSRSQRDESLRVEFATRRGEARERLEALIAAQAERWGIQLPLEAGELAVTALALSNGLALERLTEAESVPPDLFGRLIALLLAPPATGPP